MTVNDLIMSDELRVEVDNFIVTAILLGYKVIQTDTPVMGSFAIRALKEKTHFEIFLHLQNKEVTGLWLQMQNKLFRCSSSDFNGDVILPIKMINMALRGM